MQPFDVYRAKLTWRNCPDARPWLILDIRTDGTGVRAFPIAEHAYDDQCFPVDKSHPNFAATGLTKSCHVHDRHKIIVPMNCIEKYRGKFEGDLLREFLRYAF